MTQGPETARAIADILTLVLVDQQTGLAFGVGSSTAPKRSASAVPSPRSHRAQHRPPKGSASRKVVRVIGGDPLMMRVRAIPGAGFETSMTHFGNRP